MFWTLRIFTVLCFVTVFPEYQAVYILEHLVEQRFMPDRFHSGLRATFLVLPLLVEEVERIAEIFYESLSH